jgi:hypothetical protein
MMVVYRIMMLGMMAGIWTKVVFFL